MENKILVVTRHPALVDYLREQGIISGDVEIKSHVSAEDVEGRHVVGVLPHRLSCLCELFTEAPLFVPAELRGQELSLEQVRQYAGPVQTYRVEAVE